VWWQQRQKVRIAINAAQTMRWSPLPITKTTALYMSAYSAIGGA
jgi:hypothetical protein